PACWPAHPAPARPPGGARVRACGHRGLRLRQVSAGRHEAVRDHRPQSLLAAEERGARAGAALPALLHEARAHLGQRELPRGGRQGGAGGRGGKVPGSGRHPERRRRGRAMRLRRRARRRHRLLVPPGVLPGLLQRQHRQQDLRDGARRGHSLRRLCLLSGSGGLHRQPRHLGQRSVGPDIRERRLLRDRPDQSLLSGRAERRRARPRPLVRARAVHQDEHPRQGRWHHPRVGGRPPRIPEDEHDLPAARPPQPPREAGVAERVQGRSLRGLPGRVALARPARARAQRSHRAAPGRALAMKRSRLAVALRLLTALAVVGLPGLSAGIAPAAASALGDLAASMAPGTWAELETKGLTPDLLQVPRPTMVYNVLEYQNSGVWDPTSRQVLFIGGPHDGLGKFITYDEATNTWRQEPDPQPQEMLSTHGYDHNTINPRTGDFFFRPYDRPDIWRYNIPTRTWSRQTRIPNVEYNCCG